MKTISILLAALLLPATAICQSTAQLKQELKKQEAEHGEDTTKLIELAKWAKEKGLINDYRRLLTKVLKIDPNNEAAYTLKGWVKYDGQWVTKSKARLLAKKKLKAEMEAKGFHQVDGVWVTEAEVADAKKGIFRHEGELCSREEKQAFMAGKVRHPVTGAMVAAAQIDKAKDGLFPVGDGQWVSESEADKYHADQQHPWVYRTHYATLVATLPLAKIKEIAPTVDEAIEAVMPLFGGKHPKPGNRPFVVVAADGDAYRQYGEAVGAEGSSGYGVFLAQGEIQVGDLSIQPTVFDNHKDWGPYYIRHAAAMAFAAGHCNDLEVDAPLWFLRGVGSLAERYFAPGIAQWFGDQHLKKGGVKNLGEWFGAFAISGAIDQTQNDYNVFQAGLVLDYSMHGGDDGATGAVQAVTASFEKNDPQKFNAALEELQKVVVAKEDGVRTYLQKLTKGN